MERNNLKTLRDSFTESLWQEEIKPLPMPAVTDISRTFDALIVGAGITGLTTALLLQKAGKKCIIVEAGNLGFGTSGGTTAHLNTFFDSTYPEIESNFNKDAARKVADSGREALSLIRSLIEEYNIDCDFEYKDGFLYSENEKESKELKEILESSKNAGVRVTKADSNSLTVPFEMAIRFEQQAQFHPIKYMNALAEAFVLLGGVILEHTFVSETSTKEGLKLTTAGGRTLRSVDVIYATHLPPGLNQFNLRCAPYRSYVLGLKLKEGNYPQALVYDMQEPYHYFRTHEVKGQKYLIVGGEDHKTGHDDPEKAFAQLETYVKQYYEVEQIAYRWSSQYYVPVDGLPYIGSLGITDAHTYVATGFSGNGMTFGTLSAIIISDLIQGKTNQYAELYAPSRMKPVAGFQEFVKENADVAWHFIADRFGSEDLQSIASLEKGKGIVVEFKGEKLAVHKDSNGTVTALSPVCTHTGCIVNFNAAEQSWDCPCHGGRFDLSGKVVSGPPRKDLKQINVNKQ